MSHSFYAHGKLLLSGEYAVLKGARAIAVPTVKGQMLHFFANDSKELRWRSYDHQDNVWFDAVFSTRGQVIQTNEPATADYLSGLLQQAARMAHCRIPAGEAATHLEFPRNWGLGSSSTLIHLIAQWFELDPMQLFFSMHEGSGYDVACAGTNEAILYQKQAKHGLSAQCQLPEPFRKVLFIHLNQKQKSLPEVQRFLKRKQDTADIDRISKLSEKMLLVKSTAELQQVMDEHEAVMSKLLKTQTVKDRLFPDFPGSIKSLGAWGGDFIMAAGHDMSPYFHEKGYTTQRRFMEMVL